MSNERPRNRVVIEVKSGMICGVYADRPEAVQVTVVDWDVDEDSCAETWTPDPTDRMSSELRHEVTA